MDYSSDLLNRIKDLSSQLTPPVEIAALLDIDEKVLLDDINTIGHPVRMAYIKGYSETAVRMRKQNIELSDAGSPAADDACRGYMRRMTRDIDL